MDKEQMRRLTWKGCLGYFGAGLLVVWILSVKDEPGQPAGTFTSDQMRPCIAGLAAMAAMSAWNWVMPTAKETWEYTRHWAFSFLFTLLAGIGGLVYFGSLSKEQGTAVLIGIFIGFVAGFIQVGNALARNQRFE